ncbi:hypothetical protein [uncultured Arthrobacter sp.]|uniref:hypothetical protein n=1 Tax=uncultured Arthrobacter sp. TaxID=114050 RepID=UPI0037DC9680
MHSQWENQAGVCSYDTLPVEHREHIMSRVPVTGIRGIAGRLGKKLNAALGILTIADLKATDLRVRPPIRPGHSSAAPLLDAAAAVTQGFTVFSGAGSGSRSGWPLGGVVCCDGCPDFGVVLAAHTGH